MKKTTERPDRALLAKSDDPLYWFAVESNNIENIYEVRRHLTHYYALERFLKLKSITVSDLERFVKTIEPMAFLRTKPEHRVWIGGHEAPTADESLNGLRKLLHDIAEGLISPYQAHLIYEHLHPFIDGNGRSGRALWLWMMLQNRTFVADYLFLRMWYYQTLSCSRAEKP